MPALRCTVRDCAAALTQDGPLLRCGNGHAFDRAREGYWNLLQPQDRRSAHAGDRDETVIARRRWLTRGTVSALAAAIDALALPAGLTAIDVGCGEGTLTASLFHGRGLDVVGIDLSRTAVRLAALANPGMTWIVANADRALPLCDGSVSLAVSIFGRRPVAELSRVLATNGTLLVVLPGEDDLIELRAASQGDTLRRDRATPALAELLASFTLAARSAWRHRAHHDREALNDALAMSYRGARASEQARLGDVAGLDVTLSATILTLVPPPGLR